MATSQYSHSKSSILTGLDHVSTIVSQDSLIRSATNASFQPRPYIPHTSSYIINDNRNYPQTFSMDSFLAPLPLNQYRISSDPYPEVIKKRPLEKVRYTQEIAVKFLEPPQPAPGKLIIKQLPNKQIAPAPPLVVRQRPAKPVTPPPLIIREAPPLPPPTVNDQLVHVGGRIIPPPARKVILERLPPIPSKPQSVIIERWLPYKPQTRRVVYQKSYEPEVILSDPKNLIIDWEAPSVETTQEMKNLGVYKADPHEYVKRYGPELYRTEHLPQIASKATLSVGMDLDNFPRRVPEVPYLEGDVDALKLIDLDSVGLSEYKKRLY